MFGERTLDLFAAVPCGDDYVIVRQLSLCHGYGDAPPSHFAFVRRGMIADQGLITPSVIMTLELQALHAAGRRSGETERQEDDFRTAVCERYLAAARNNFGRQFGYLEFEIVLSAEGEIAADLGGDGLGDAMRRMPEDQRTQRETEVDVLVAIDIPHPAAIALIEEQWVRADAAAESAGDTASQSAGRSLEAL